MLAWLRSRWKEIGESWRECLHLEPPGYRVDAVPTSDEMAARAAQLEGELVLERVRRKTVEQDLERLRGSRCNNPHHAMTDGTPWPHGIVSSCMASAQPLTRAQVQRLVELVDACAKVQRAAGKALLYGYRPAPRSNGGEYLVRAAVENGIGDLLAAAERMEAAADLNPKAIERYRSSRAARLATEAQPAQ